MYAFSNISTEARERLASIDITDDISPEETFILPDGSHLATHFFEPKDLEEALAAEHVVMLIRYLDDKGEASKVGVHLVNTPEEGWYTRFAFTSRTVGLMNTALLTALMHWLYVNKADIDIATCGETPMDATLLDYIERQIIPLEWKSEWAAGDRELMKRVGVLSKVAVNA